MFWRQAGSKTPATKNDSKTTSLKITGLKSGVSYECVVKAGNSRGTSTLTEPVKFTTDEKYITSAASMGKGNRILSSKSSHVLYVIKITKNKIIIIQYDLKVLKLGSCKGKWFLVKKFL